MAIAIDVKKMNTVQLVNQLASLDKSTKSIKSEKDAVETELQKRAADTLADTKNKQVKLYGSDGNVVTVTNAESVKLISLELLKGILKDGLKDFLKEKTSTDLTDPLKKILAPIFLGDYVEISKEDVLKQLKLDEKTFKLAMKKLKGNFEKDIAFFESIGMKTKEAEENAYLIKEAIAYDKICTVLKVSGYKSGTQEFKEVINDINNAIIVEETIKISVDYEKDGSN